MPALCFNNNGSFKKSCTLNNILLTHDLSLVQEKLAFVDWINFRLSKDEYYSSFGKGCLPIKEDGEALFVALKDGILLK